MLKNAKYDSNNLYFDYTLLPYQMIYFITAVPVGKARFCPNPSKV